MELHPFSGVIAIIVLFGMVYDLRMGHWVVTLPILVAALGLTYTIRGFLVNNVSTMRDVMNIVAIASIAANLLLPKAVGPEPLWLRAMMIGFLSIYMGCYFWMLSDENITAN